MSKVTDKPVRMSGMCLILQARRSALLVADVRPPPPPLDGAPESGGALHGFRPWRDHLGGVTSQAVPSHSRLCCQIKRHSTWSHCHI